MSYRFFITGSGIAPEAQSLLEKNNCIFLNGSPEDTEEDLVYKISKFNPDVLIVRQGNISSMVIDSAKNLKVICKHGVGTDNIDIDAAAKKGIPVFITHLANYESVAEHTLALLLSLMRKINIQNRIIREGVFAKKNYDGLELYGKTIGLIGFGRIGRRFCELLSPFKMHGIVFHPSNTSETMPLNFSKTSSLENIFSQADIISLHCPLTPKTRHLINKSAFSIMKKGAYLINTARGGIIKEDDLIQALQKKLIAGAALDVFEDEPPQFNNQLFAFENVIVTSHIAGISDNSFKNMGIGAVENALKFLGNNSYDDALINHPAILHPNF